MVYYKVCCVRDFSACAFLSGIADLSLQTRVPAENFQVPSANRMARTSDETINGIINIYKQQSHEIQKELRVEHGASRIV